MSWLRSHIYLILRLGAVPKLLPSTTHIVTQFTVASKADQPVGSARSPSPRWAFPPGCWAACSELRIQAKTDTLQCLPANTVHGRTRDTQEKRNQSSSAPYKIKAVKRVPCSVLTPHKNNNGPSKDTVGQERAYAWGGLMDWQLAECQSGGLTPKQRHNVLCSL